MFSFVLIGFSKWRKQQDCEGRTSKRTAAEGKAKARHLKNKTIGVSPSDLNIL